jgi:hypothetical protein
VLDDLPGRGLAEPLPDALLEGLLFGQVAFDGLVDEVAAVPVLGLGQPVERLAPPRLRNERNRVTSLFHASYHELLRCNTE